MRAAARVARERMARKHRRGGVLRWAVSLASAAVLVLALGVGWRTWNPAQPEQHYATAVGERRTLKLDDGSIALLDPDPAPTVRYSRLRRDVVMERGPAPFTFAPRSEQVWLGDRR